jgi:Ca-activated chloride channel homolog
MNIVIKNTHRIVVLITLLLMVNHATADDKTLSPYFKIISEHNGNQETLPLMQTTAQVDIAGVIADVKVRQVYRNRGDTPIEAVYVFPGSTRAAVYAMQMTIGERVIVAKIQERTAAKANYDKAKQAGKRAALLEQQRPNVFQMNVANIMPGDQVIVELSYTELVIPEQGVYEFAYPAVVGPRYSELPVEGADNHDIWITNPYLHEGVQAPYHFDINVTLVAGLPIHSLLSPSHNVQVAYTDKNQATVNVKAKEQYSGDRDYIIRYQLRGKEIEAGLLLYRGEQENFFLLMAQPPQRVKPENIPPREYIFVVDVSGSMHGFPLDISKKLMVELLTRLRPSDRFNIVFFSGGSNTLAENSLPATQDHVQQAIAMMERQRGGGGTRLLPALQKAMNLPAAEATSRSFVVITDGYISVETDVFDYVKNHLNQANFFAFGIGSSINRFLIDGLARSGRGEPFVITKPSEALPIAQRFREYIETPVLTGIDLEFDDFDAYAVEPAQIPDMFAEKPLLVYGKWRGGTTGEIKIHGFSGQHEYNQTIAVNDTATSAENSALRYLWARSRITELGDYQKLQSDSERKAEITNLGLTYNLLTAYTSFIAIDEIAANPNGNSQQVKQPLPLPKGVSNLAVGGVVPTTPEPEITLLLAVLGCLFIVVWLKHVYRLRSDRSLL